MNGQSIYTRKIPHKFAAKKKLEHPLLDDLTSNPERRSSDLSHQKICSSSSVSKSDRIERWLKQINHLHVLLKYMLVLSGRRSRVYIRLFDMVWGVPHIKFEITNWFRVRI